MERGVTRRLQLLAAAVSAAAVAVLAVVCGDSPQPTAVKAVPREQPPALPPDDFAFFEREFGPALESAGLRLTRAGLQSVPGDYGADVGDEPRHLALYVEPLSASFSNDEFLDSLVGSARVFLPEVFEAWPGLVSMDVCQEPPPGVDDQPAPPPVTVLEMTREAAQTLAWDTIDLTGLVAAKDDQLVKLIVAPRLRVLERWKAATGAEIALNLSH